MGLGMSIALWGATILQDTLQILKGHLQNSILLQLSNFSCKIETTPLLILQINFVVFSIFRFEI